MANRFAKRSIWDFRQHLGAALGNATPIKRVIELDRRQPEFTMTFEEYLGKIASATRARVAAKKLIEHDEILTKVSKKYGVQKRYIVTFWGVETSLVNILDRLVYRTLWQLLPMMEGAVLTLEKAVNALKILEEGHIRRIK